MGEQKRTRRQAVIDAARLIGYTITPSPGTDPGMLLYALQSPDGMWVSDAPLHVASFRFMWMAAVYALQRENIDVSTLVSRGDLRACESGMRAVHRRRADYARAQSRAYAGPAKPR